MPTLGGCVFWNDVGEIEGWRMQQNILTGHWRLLDPRNIRFAWGTNRKMVDIFVKAAQREKDGETIAVNCEEADVSADLPSSNADTEDEEGEET
jgi:hypothetical protein